MKGSILLCFVFYSIVGICQNEEQITKSDLQKLAPKRFVSSISLFGGPSFLYPTLLINNANQSSDTKYGYLFGASGLHSVKRFDFEGKILFDRKRFGQTYYYNPNDPSSKSINDVANDYISVILVSKYAIDQKGYFKIGIGGYLSFLTKSQTTIAFMNLGVPNFVGTIDSYEYYKSTDFGVVSSLSYQRPINSTYSFGVELLNSNGLTIVSNPSISPSTIPVPINRNNNVSLIFIFNIKLKNLAL